MKAIDSAIEATIGKEGRYSNNKHDKGGETMWGITIAVARANGYAGPMIDMPRATAVEIYRKEYYLRPGYGRVAELSTSIAEELFDTGVNMGVNVASTFLQRALNVLNRTHSTQPLFPDLKIDGAVGNITLTALSIFLKQRGKDGELVMLTMLNCLQGVRYIELCEAREANEEFVYGWFKNRVVI